MEEFTGSAKLLRSVIGFGDTVKEQDLVTNYHRLKDSIYTWSRPEDQKLFGFVTDFFQQSAGGIPSVQSIKDHFGRAEDAEVLERLDDLGSVQPYTGSNFDFLLRNLIEDQGRIEMMHLLKEAAEVVTKGKDIVEGRTKKRIQGVRDAIMYFNTTAQKLVPHDFKGRVSGDIRMDAQEAWEEYTAAKNNPELAWGKLMGIPHVDEACHGVKKGELWLHAGFAGELKTTTAISWSYNLATRYRTNVLYCAFEMPYTQMRRKLNARHTGNKRFELMGRKPLSYRKIRDGELNPEEEEFYQEALKDLTDNPEYSRLEMWVPPMDVGMNDVRMHAEMLHREMEVGMIVLDHAANMTPSEWDSSYTIRLNSVLRDAKKLAMHFNCGEGVPVLCLFQINREGKKEAAKNGGTYSLGNLSYANEAERSADYVTATYLDDELREAGQSVMCNMKNRDNPLFKTFNVGVDYEGSRLYQMADPTEGVSIEESNRILDNLSNY